MKKHRAGIIGLAVHPSSRLVLSSNRRNKLCLFNVITGRLVWSKKTRWTLQGLCWSLCGRHFVGRTEDGLLCFDIEKNLEEYEWYSASSQVLCSCYVYDAGVVVGGLKNGEIVL